MAAGVARWGDPAHDKRLGGVVDSLYKIDLRWCSTLVDDVESDEVLSRNDFGGRRGRR